MFWYKLNFRFCSCPLDYCCVHLLLCSMFFHRKQ
ncbi:MAG: SWIM zinc finger family protein [Bacteroidetes bacterium]|nr:SWIM zinc finger family protein [Bacteroidota bacterium]